MKLPNSKKAYVPEEKLLNYLLSDSHPDGKSKAKFFKSLGFNTLNVKKLHNQLLSLAHKNDVSNAKKTSHGTNYLIIGAINTPLKEIVQIRTIWVIDLTEPSPRFVTAYPLS